MQITVRTLNSQRKLTIQKIEELEPKIKEVFKTESFQLFTDFEKTKPISVLDVKDSSTVFMSYEMGEIKTFKEDFKCNHSTDAVCPHCVNVDVIDKAITPGKKVKYFSYLSYIEALKEQNKKKDEYDYILKKCESHPENQKCMKCMDKQITLTPQPYRYIDYVEFDSSAFLENFINDYKSSGRQQIGLLVGTVVENPDIPMGKKAIVSAIWRIQQENFPDGFAINEIPPKFFAPELSILGVIYTDLMYKDKILTSSRAIGNFEISTLEIDFIASLGLKYNNEEFFGICVTTNKENQIEPSVFMVSEQYKALIKANAIGISTDPKMFVSNRDIVYFINNEYDKKVSKKADPLMPVWYFILTCPVGFNEHPMFLKNITIKKGNASRLAGYFQNDFSFDNFKCFSILCMLDAFIPKLVPELFTAVIQNDEKLFAKIAETENFKDFRNNLKKHITDKWNCKQCTYLNDGYKSSCEICTARKE